MRLKNCTFWVLLEPIQNCNEHCHCCGSDTPSHVSVEYAKWSDKRRLLITEIGEEISNENVLWKGVSHMKICYFLKTIFSRRAGWSNMKKRMDGCNMNVLYKKYTEMYNISAIWYNCEKILFWIVTHVYETNIILPLQRTIHKSRDTFQVNNYFIFKLKLIKRHIHMMILNI